MLNTLNLVIIKSTNLNTINWYHLILNHYLINLILNVLIYKVFRMLLLNTLNYNDFPQSYIDNK